MTLLLSLDAPAPGSTCPRCREPLRIEGFCAECFERSMRAREKAIKAKLAEARKRARTWQLGRGVQA